MLAQLQQHGIVFVDPSGADECLEQSDLGDVSQALKRMKIRTGMRSLWLMPNFRFNYLPPPTGWVGTFAQADRFRHGAFQYDKYRCMTMVKCQVEEKDMEPDRLRAIQRRLQIQFPMRPAVPPGLGSSVEGGGFSPALGMSGCSIGVYKHLDETNKPTFYIVCHSSLPDALTDELQEHERAVHESCDEWERRDGVVSERLLQRAPANMNMEEFSDGGLQKRMEELSREVGMRNVALFSQIADIRVERGLIENEDGGVVYDAPGGDFSDPALFDEALARWGRDRIVYPFSRIEGGPDDNIHGYRLGKMVKTRADDKTVGLGNVRYDETIYTIIPTAQTVYNTFRVNAGVLYTYNNCCAINEPFLVDRGLNLGYRLYNYNAETGKALLPLLKNDYGAGFPCVFPYTPVPTMQVETHVKNTFFSNREGEISGPIGQINKSSGAGLLPAQLMGQHLSGSLTDDVVGRLLPGLPPAMLLTPVFVLLSPEQARGVVI